MILWFLIFCICAFPSEVNGKEGLDIGDPKLTSDMNELLVKEKFEVNHDMSFLDPQWQITINDYFDSIHNLGILIFKDESYFIWFFFHFIVQGFGLDICWRIAL